ncbi:MAG TPA: hypothetical protein VII36_07515, partial [Usitatibacter sp.]
AGKLKDAKTGLLQERLLARAQDASLASTLAEELLLDRTLAFDAKIDNDISAVTLEQVNAAFRKYFDPAKLVTVRAGDFAKGAAK